MTTVDGFVTVLRFIFYCNGLKKLKYVYSEVWRCPGEFSGLLCVSTNKTCAENELKTSRQLYGKHLTSHYRMRINIPTSTPLPLPTILGPTPKPA